MPFKLHAYNDTQRHHQKYNNWFSTALQIAKCSTLIFYLPMQFRGPALNGIQEYGCLFSVSSGKNLSGSNFKGSCHSFGSLWAWYIPRIQPLPFGTVQEPETIHEIINFHDEDNIRNLMSSDALLPIIAEKGNSRNVSLITLSKYFMRLRSSPVRALALLAKISCCSLKAFSCNTLISS